MPNITIDLVQESDLEPLSEINATIYPNFWTTQTSLALFEHFYRTKPDLFLCAHVDGKVVGAVMSNVKPWWDGPRLTDTEIFVSKDYQKHGIAKLLLTKHLELAQQIYHAVGLEAITYEDETGFPYSWYEKLGFDQDPEVIFIRGKIATALQELKEK
ncbi:GNAT family N-acetyltransferase [Candidatus Saccharibacteria bacterium]|nr:GNAT family N-acetyltransferase [Candidatus Saccharibacteria bacterium]